MRSNAECLRIQRIDPYVFVARQAGQCFDGSLPNFTCLDRPAAERHFACLQFVQFQEMLISLSSLAQLRRLQRAARCMRADAALAAFAWTLAQAVQTAILKESAAKLPCALSFAQVSAPAPRFNRRLSPLPLFACICGRRKISATLQVAEKRIARS